MSGRSVRVHELGFRYPGSGRPVLDGFSLEIEAGERVAVLGPNGSGKTTFVLHLNGLLELQTGEITIGDVPVSGPNLDEIRRAVGMVFQDPDDQLFMQTVRDDVAFGPANIGIARHHRDQLVTDTLRSVGAGHLAERAPHRLSGGEKRRVALATVLALRPHVLVLDEPTSGLDPVGRRELAELLDSFDHTQVIVTHDLPFALATCSRSVVVAGGRVTIDRSTAELFADPELLARHGLELPLGFMLSPRPGQ